jgi:hypothetical protein
MGIATNLIPVLVEGRQAHAWSGDLLQLGRQDLEIDSAGLATLLAAEGFAPVLPSSEWAETGGHITPESFFGALGFDRVESLDVSDAEGATRVFDLNEKELPEDLRGRYDCLFDGGTLEHVFDLPNALSRCAEMLRPGGWLLHVGPLNNYADHGFYQFSPTFWFDWCAANNWAVAESALLRLPVSSRRGDRRWEITFLPPGRLGPVGALDDAPYMHWFAARMGAGSRHDVIPLQACYAQRYGRETVGGGGLRHFSGFAVADGRRQPLGQVTETAPRQTSEGLLARLLRRLR